MILLPFGVGNTMRVGWGFRDCFLTFEIFLIAFSPRGGSVRLGESIFGPFELSSRLDLGVGFSPFSPSRHSERLTLVSLRCRAIL